MAHVTQKLCSIQAEIKRIHTLENDGVDLEIWEEGFLNYVDAYWGYSLTDGTVKESNAHDYSSSIEEAYNFLLSLKENHPPVSHNATPGNNTKRNEFEEDDHPTRFGGSSSGGSDYSSSNDDSSPGFSGGGGDFGGGGSDSGFGGDSGGGSGGGDD